MGKGQLDEGGKLEMVEGEMGGKGREGKGGNEGVIQGRECQLLMLLLLVNETRATRSLGGGRRGGREGGGREGRMDESQSP